MNDAVGSNLTSRLKNEYGKRMFMNKLNLQNNKLPAAGKPKTEMGLLNGELNLLMRNLGIEEEEAK